MPWLALILVTGFGVYVMRPDERRRVLVRLDESLALARDFIQNRRRSPDAFREALAARTRYPFVTAAVLFVNLAIFAGMLAGSAAMSDPATLVSWGGSTGPLTTNGQWWRLITATFVHAGVVQLAVDVAALAQAAMLVERMCGHVALVGVYLMSAAFAASIGLWAEPLAVTSGASASIFGIYGLLVAIVVRGTLRRSSVTIPLRVLRRLAPAAAVFVIYYLSAGGVQWRAGLATFVIGFAVGLALTRHMAERVPSLRRVLLFATTVLTIVVGVAAPLSGMSDARSEIARIIAVEQRTCAAYRVATEDFKLGRIKAEALAQVIERAIVPELQATGITLNAVGGVPRQQQALVAAAHEYLRLRCQSWVVRAQALHKLNARLLREADQQERASLEMLEKIKPAAAAAGGNAS